MSFIKHADFIIRPSEQYANDFIYLWSDFNSTPNPDGIVRLPFRWPFMLSNWLFGERFTAYFYLAFVIVFCYFAMHFFLRKFVGLQSKAVVAISAIMFCFNPVFLGNTSKIGLQFGVACLLFMLVFAKKYFYTRSFIWLLAIIVLLLGSLVHPFTLIVNSAVLGVYCARHIKEFSVRHISLGLLLGIGLSAYIWLPTLALGTVSRSQFETDTSQAQDFTNLVDIAKTESLLEGSTLSKSVLEDFRYYDEDYQRLYVVSVLLLLVIILLPTLRKSTSKNLQLIYYLSLISFATLIALAGVTGDAVRTLIVFIIETPAGWAFRSPLKWQLYIPVVLFIALALALTALGKRLRTVAIVVVVLCFFGMNGFISYDIYGKLLKPKQPTTFSSLTNQNIAGRRILFMRDYPCGQYLTENHRIFSELDYILQTSLVQVTYAGPSDIPHLNLNDFSYVIDCTNYAFTQNNAWQPLAVTAGPIRIYATNQTSNAASASSSNSVWNGKGFDVTTLENIVRSTSGAQAYIVNDTQLANGEVHEVLNGVSKANFMRGFINSTINIAGSYQNIRLLSGSSVDNERILVNQNLIELIGDEVLQRNGIQGAAESRPIPVSNRYEISYSGEGYSFENTVPNPSFEKGLWQQEVGDCFRYDNNPRIAMNLSQTAYEGSNALSLSATRHMACTSTGQSVPVRPGGHAFVSFKANVQTGNRFRFVIQFNNPERSYIERVYNNFSLGEWREYTNFIDVPENATSMELIAYAVPVVQGLQESVVLYDDFFATDVPDINNKLFIVATDKSAQQDGVISVQKHDPVSYTIELASTLDSTYVQLKERFNPGWHITAINGQSSKPFIAGHGRDSNSYNIWRLQSLGIIESDTIQLTISFTPQRWFYLGSIISSTTLVGAISYLVYDNVKRRRTHYSIKHKPNKHRSSTR